MLYHTLSNHYSILQIVLLLAFYLSFYINTCILITAWGVFFKSILYHLIHHLPLSNIFIFHFKLHTEIYTQRHTHIPMFLMNWDTKGSGSCSVMSDSLQPHRLYSPWNSPGQNTGMDSLSLLQGTFPTQGLNPGVLHCRWILYQLSHRGSPRILECVAYPFSSRSSWLKNQTGVSCIAGRFFTNWALREAQKFLRKYQYI